MPTLKEWMQQVRNRPKTVDLVEGLISSQPSYILLGGRTGIGKSILAIQLLLSIASGTDFLGIPTRTTKVGYLGFEGDDTKMCDRLEKVGLSFPNGASENFAEFEISTAKRLWGNEAWFQAKYGGKGIGLLALDPLKYLVSGDYSKPSDALHFIGAVQKLSVDLGAPVFLVHHIRKRDKRALIEPGDLDELKGAGDYSDHASTVMLLERERQRHNPAGGFAPVRADHFVLYFPKARDAPASFDPIPIKLNRDKLLFERSEPDMTHVPGWAGERD